MPIITTGVAAEVATVVVDRALVGVAAADTAEAAEAGRQVTGFLKLRKDISSRDTPVAYSVASHPAVTFAA